MGTDFYRQAEVNRYGAAWTHHKTVNISEASLWGPPLSSFEAACYARERQAVN
jgi:hypothetical protein